MDDLGSLASSIAAVVNDVRGCLILSKDGLVLDAYPQSGEVEAKHAWVRFAAVGDPDRGFAQFGTETWCYIRRGPYAAFAIIGPGTRPGVAIDHMEQILLAAEEARRHPVLKEPVASPAPTTKPRTTMHPESRPADDPLVIQHEAPARVGAEVFVRTEPPVAAEPPIAAEPPTAAEPPGAPEPPTAAEPPTAVEPPVAAEPPGAAEPPTAAELRMESFGRHPEPSIEIAGREAGPFTQSRRPVEPLDRVAPTDLPDLAPSSPRPSGAEAVIEGGPPQDDEHEDVDRFSLAREFGQLLQDDDAVADG